MKKTVLTFIFLIGLYTLLRHNVGRLPGQLVWIPNPEDIFYKVFIPSLMALSAIVALAKNKNINYFFLALGVMFIDAINRLSVGVNYFYLYQMYKHIPEPEALAGSTVVVINLWPSHIIFLIEAALIILFLLNLRARKQQGKTRGQVYV